MAVAFIREDGGHTRAVDAPTALVYWYMGIEKGHNQYTEVARYGQVSLSRGPTFVINEGDQFIDQIIGCIERNYGLTPVIYQGNDHEAKCTLLLHFLHEHGKITKLCFAESPKDLPPVNWRDLPILPE